MVNYGLILFLYSPVLLLFLVTFCKERFSPENKVFRSQYWSLKLGMLVIGFFTTAEIIKSLWTIIPIMRNYEYNLSNWEIVVLFGMCFILFMIYFLLNFVYKVSIIEVFNLKSIYFPFILKLCGILTIINIMSIFLFKFNLFLNPQKSQLEMITQIDLKNIILYFFNSIIVVPITEESIFRGVIYAPLYRKLGRNVAIVLTSVIWTQQHFQGFLPSFGIFINGLILAWLYDRRGSLIHPIIFHMFRNSWIIIYYFVTI